MWHPHKVATRSEVETHSIWFLLGLRSSLSMRVSFLFLIPGSLSPIFVDRANYGGSLLLWIQIVLIAHAIFTVVLLISQKLIHGSRQTESHPALTVVAFVVAQMCRGGFVGQYIVDLGLSDDPQWTFRFISGGIFILTISSVLAVSVSAFDQHGKIVFDLAKRLADLEDLRSTMDDRLAALNGQLRDYANEVISPRLEEIDELLISIKSVEDTSKAIFDLQRYVDDELRPLSHKIARDRSAVHLDNAKTVHANRFTIPRSMVLSESIRPFVSTGLFFITFAAAAQRTMIFQRSLLFQLATLVSLLAYFYIVRQALGTRILPTPIAVLVGLGIFALTGPYVLAVLTSLGIESPPHISVATILVGILFGSANVVYSLLTSERLQLSASLQLANREIEDAVSLLKQREWIARRRVSYAMHGTLQSSLNAAILRLGYSEVPTNSTIDEIRFDIAHALDRVKREQGSDYLFRAAKYEITHLWAGTIDINWNIDDQTMAVLDLNPTASECLAEVIREAVSNASRHGNATHIDIDISVNRLILTVRAVDNGKLIDHEAIPGLGHELLDDVCIQWSLVPEPNGGMNLTAKILLEVC
ncbi:MAG: hypothetical protein F2839_00285 [Actinobacteria bacterium]|uniref:Unannotated protein n=1 Tax=freshwater metagenome TaxID=449393 RepID=A0A6J5YIX0_9ZZZZ|nr:hypothetical protein [Actinomycetota bacterium]